MRKLIQDGVQIIAAILITGGTAYAMTPAAESAPPVKETIVKAESVSDVNVPDKPAVPAPEQAVVPEIPAPVVVPVAPPVVLDNETIIWNYLIGKGFTREQTAGIMGNLQQEHGFKTSDELPAGIGLAQWIGARADKLMAKANYLDINVQLDHLMEELNGNEALAHSAIKASTSVYEATVAFQNKFERCGVCMQDQRLGYAQNVLQRH